jgi:polyisoprenoid-binding protein YceI
MQRRPRRWLRRGVVAVVVLVVLVVGGPFVFIHFIEGKAPAKLTLSAAAGHAGPNTGSVPLDGKWSVTTGSVVGYRVKEVLFGQDNTAVGRTSDVTGSIIISGTNVVAGTFTVEMATVKSDFSQRDSQFRGRVMDVSTYPTATFVLSQPIKVGAPAASGVAKAMAAEGSLTLRGQTRTVSFEVEARHVGTTIQVLGSVPVLFSRWKIPNPSFGPVTTQDHGILEFLLDVRHGVSAAPPVPVATPTSAPPGASSLASFRACMAAHGVKLSSGFPGNGGHHGPGGGGPGGGGPGGRQGAGTKGPGGFGSAGGLGGGGPQATNPKTAAAMKACSHLLPAQSSGPISVPRTTVPPLTL